MAIMESIEGKYALDQDRLMDIVLCKAIGLQIRSSRNIFMFYDMREKLPFMKKVAQLKTLDHMEAIVREEISNSLTMKILCEKDPRLGFHSEAEGYKFFPKKLAWRAGLLKDLLAKDFSEIRTQINNGKTLFPEHTGIAPNGKTYVCTDNRKNSSWEYLEDRKTSWRAWNDGKKLCFEARLTSETGNELLGINIEPRRLWPAIKLGIDVTGRKSTYPFDGKWDAPVKKDGQHIIVNCKIPHGSIPYFDGKKKLRLNVLLTDVHHLTDGGSWVKLNPLPSRLLFGSHNSADMGWLLPPDHVPEKKRK